MYCPNCGNDLPDDAKFCIFCGTKINIGQPEEKAEPVDEKPSVDKGIRRLVILLVIVCAAAAAACLFVRFGLPEREAADYTAKVYEENSSQEVLPIWEALDRESVRDLLRLFDDYYDKSGKTEIVYEGLEDADVYQRAALAILMDQGPEAASGEYREVSGDMYSADEISGMSGVSAGSGIYGLLPTETYEDYLRKMFGSGYSTKDFVWDDSGAYGLILKQDKEGNFYLYIGDTDIFIPQFNGIVRTGYDPDAGEDGAYVVLAVYITDLDEDYFNEGHALFWIVPDEEAEYGCVVIGMTDAGIHTVDEAVERYMDSLEDSEAEDE